MTISVPLASTPLGEQQLPLLQIQAHRIDAEMLTLLTFHLFVEHMTEVRTALPAVHLGPAHAERVVWPGANIFCDGRV